MRSIFLAAIFFSSCSSLAVEKYELGEMNIDAGFLILFDSRGSALKASDAFAIHQGEITFGELPYFDLDRDQSVVLLSIDSAQIAASERLFDASKLAEARVVLEPGSEKPQAADDGKERIAIPAETKVFMLRDGAMQTFDGDRAALLAELSLVVLLDSNKCQIPNLPPLAAFTRDLSLRVPPQYDLDTYRNFVGMKIVDGETALALTDYTVLLAKKGRRWELMPAGTGTAGSVLFREALQPPEGMDLRVYGLDIDRVLRPDGTYRVIAVASDNLRDAPPLPAKSAFGLIYEIAVSSEAIERVETIGRVDFGLVAAAMGPDGTAGLVGNNGHFLLVDRNRQITELPPVAQNVPYAPQSVTWTKDQDRPWVVGAVGHIYVYDARSESWDTWVIPIQDPIEVESLAAARTPAGELELWAGGSRGVLFRRLGDGAWEIIDPVMPPSFQHCSTGGAYPELDFDGHFDALAIYGSHVLATLRDCSAIMELRRDDLCIALLAEEGNAIEAQLNRDVQTMDVLGEQIVVGGEGALIIATER